MIILLLALLGLIFGSFVNAFVWRLHEQEELREGVKKPSKKKLEELSILKGRSMCPHCHHELAAKDLIPLVSWLSLRGKCRYCHKPISAQYPLVEALTAVLFALSYAWWPLELHGAGLVQFVFWLGFVVAFVALAVYDLKWFLLPDKIVYPLIGAAAVEVITVAIMQHGVHVLLDAALGALVISGVFYLLFQVSGGKWIGGGDVKLAVVLGLLAGTPLKAGDILRLGRRHGVLHPYASERQEGPPDAGAIRAVPADGDIYCRIVW
jgi:leader peptidase (prepilin peptidase)/N-methyltransferase